MKPPTAQLVTKMPYAEGTAVPVMKTRMEIEAMLKKHRASHVGVMTGPGRVQVLFTIEGWSVTFRMSLPTDADARDWKDPRSSWRAMSAAGKAARLERTERERWRALLLTLKAKLVSVENGVETLEEAFLAHLVVDPSGQTVGDQALPKLRSAHVSSAKRLGAGG